MGQYDWWVGCSASVNNGYSNTQAQVTVKCYLVNNGWNYTININSWTKCDGGSWWKTDTTYVDSTGVSSNGGWAYAGEHTYTINKGTSNRSVPCQAGVKDTSGNAYAGGYDRTSSTQYVTVNAKPSYTVSYNGNSTYNGYTNSTVSGLPGNQTKWYDDALTLSGTKPTKANTIANGPTVTLNYNYSGSTNSSLTPTDTYSYSFSKWNTSSNGSGTSYNASASYTTNGAATLYAIWTQSKSAGSVTLPTPTRAGFTFLGWATSSTGAVVYNGGASYTPSAAVTLYAIWRANLDSAYVLKATSKTSTWQTLIDSQTTSGSTLYGAGGQYSGWTVDGSGYVCVFGKQIKLNGDTLVKSTDKPQRGATYKYYI